MRVGDKMVQGLFSEKYQIIKVLLIKGEIKYFLGRSNVLGDERLMLINEITNRKWINTHLGEILVKAENQRIPGFYECFTEQEKLFVTFIYNKGISLPLWLEKHPLSLDERILLLCRILEKFSEYQNCPLILQNSIIQAENIVIEGNALAFNYHLIADDQPDARVNTVFEKLGMLLDTVFTGQEVAKKMGIKIILEKCKKNIYLSVGEMMRDLLAIKDEPSKRFFSFEQIQKKEQAVLKFLSPVFFLGLGISVVFYVWQNWYASSSVVIEPVVKQIGSVEVAKRHDNEVGQDIIVNVQQFPLKIAIEATHPTDRAELAPWGDYLIREGDTLINICEKQYGSASYVPKLAEYNHISDKDMIYEGNTLKLPDKGTFTQD